MGKGADIYSGFKRNDDDFPYKPAGIYRLLKEYHRLEGRLVPGGDYDTAVILQDLKTALDSDVLTARQRQVVALYYFADLIEDDVADILGISRQGVNRAIIDALGRISAFISGHRGRVRGYHVTQFENRRPLFQWVNAVGDGRAPVYVVPNYIRADIIDWLAENGDKRAQNASRQLRSGPPSIIYEYQNPEDEYPCLNPRQMQYREKMQVPVEEVKPKLDVAAVKKGPKGRKTKIYVLNK